MFVGVVLLQPTLAALTSQGKLLAGVTTVLLSVGAYVLLLRTFVWLFGHWQLLRKLVLGRSFLEGTWVGHYVKDGKDLFTIERINQASGATVLLGRELKSDGKTRARWASDAVSIDETRMQLTYAYTCDVFERKHTQQGLGTFTIVRENSWWPDKLDGYAADLIDGVPDPNIEIKISCREISDAHAIAKAKEYFCQASA
jgi:hypothetical protein